MYFENIVLWNSYIIECHIFILKHYLLLPIINKTVLIQNWISRLAIQRHHKWCEQGSGNSVILLQCPGSRDGILVERSRKRWLALQCLLPENRWRAPVGLLISQTQVVTNALHFSLNSRTNIKLRVGMSPWRSAWRKQYSLYASLNVTLSLFSIFKKKFCLLFIYLLFSLVAVLSASYWPRLRLVWAGQLHSQ